MRDKPSGMNWGSFIHLTQDLSHFFDESIYPVAYSTFDNDIHILYNNDGMKDIWMILYKKENIRKMMFKTLWRTRNFKAAYWVYGTNHNYGRIVLEDMINDKPDGMNRDLVWNSGKRSLYLKLTDYILMVFYAISWNKMVDRFRGSYL